MMISPEAFMEEYRHDDYLQLIAVRDELLEAIKEFEEKEIAGDRSGEEWNIIPQPDTVYQMHLEYLGKICALMQEKYNADYAWGERTLREDAERNTEE